LKSSDSGILGFLFADGLELSGLTLKCLLIAL